MWMKLFAVVRFSRRPVGMVRVGGACGWSGKSLRVSHQTFNVHSFLHFIYPVWGEG